jgi:DNA-binding beta-propeller fold protein YncE
MPTRGRTALAVALSLGLAGCGGGAGAPRPSASSAAAATGIPSPVASPTFGVAAFAPGGLALDAQRNLYTADCEDGYVFRIDPSGGITAIAGTGFVSLSGGISGDGGPAVKAQLDCPADLAFDPDGNLLVADHANNRIREIDHAGIIHTVVGGGPLGTGPAAGELKGDGGPAIKAWLQEPQSIVFDQLGNLYIADRDNHAIRRVDTRGIITTIAGTGTEGFSGDGGQATQAKLAQPLGLAFDAAGNLYFADSANFRIRRIDTHGVITTVAGTGGAGYSGDGGPAIRARMDPEDALAFDAAGDLYLVDLDHHVVRMIDPRGTITTVAGTGTAGCSGFGGPATAAELDTPDGLLFGPNGDLYVADDRCGILRVGGNGIITLLASAGG